MRDAKVIGKITKADRHSRLCRNAYVICSIPTQEYDTSFRSPKPRFCEISRGTSAIVLNLTNNRNLDITRHDYTNNGALGALLPLNAAKVLSSAKITLSFIAASRASTYIGVPNRRFVTGASLT